MTAPTIALTAAEVAGARPTPAETAAEIIAYGWDVYRRSQQAAWPQDPEAAGTLMRAQSRLWHQTAPFACASLYAPGVGPDLGGIQDATAILIATIGEHCGNDAAAFASGQDRSAAA